MCRTIGFVVYFWAFCFAATILYLPLWIFRVADRIAADSRLETRLLAWLVLVWSRSLLYLVRASVSVAGRTNVPRDNRLCVVSNHQGYADILIIGAFLGKKIGFVAKRELASVPLLGTWMRTFRCIFIDRSDLRHARKRLAKGSDVIRAGHPLVVFPEGTRSKGGPMRTFRAGSLRVARDAQAVILPISINGTADLLEKHRAITRGHVDLVIHEPVSPIDYNALGRVELSERLHAIIQSGCHLRWKTSSGLPTPPSRNP